MNCLPTTSKTGRARAGASPIDQPKDRVGADIGDADIAGRLRAHLAPHGRLVAVGKFNAGKNHPMFLGNRTDSSMGRPSRSKRATTAPLAKGADQAAPGDLTPA